MALRLVCKNPKQDIQDMNLLDAAYCIREIILRDYGTSRVDVIGQNGNEGLHYEEQTK